MRNSARMTGDFLRLRSGDTALLCLSPSTIAGKMMIVRSFELNLKLLVVDVQSNPLKKLTASIDFAAMVPMQVESAADQNLEALTSIDKLIIGGAAVHPKLIDQLKGFPKEIWQTFGMTETISHIAMRRLNGDQRSYQPLPGVQVAAEHSHLVIHAPALGIDHLKTNDLVELTAGGFNWLGRSDFVINSGGVKIHPELVEEKLSPIMDGNFFSSSVPDDRLGERHILCIECSESNLNLQQLKNLLDAKEVPRTLYLFERFEYTESGKINRLETLKKLNHATERVL